MTGHSFELDTLADPKKFHGELDLTGISVKCLRDYMAAMLRIRLAEQQLAFGRREGFIGGPVHGVGQEAVAVGVSKHLRASDRVFGAHRSHSHLLALGSSIFGLFAEVLGKNAGHSAVWVGLCTFGISLGVFTDLFPSSPERFRWP